jgi:hypothetical protein
MVDHPGEQLLLGIIARGVAHHALVLGQLAFKVERIVPFERGILDLRAFRRVRLGLLRKLAHRVFSLTGAISPLAPSLGARLASGKRRADITGDQPLSSKAVGPRPIDRRMPSDRSRSTIRSSIF